MSFAFLSPEGLSREGIHWTSRVFSGPDSRDFLHRLTTLDVRNLRPGHPPSSSWGFILTATGRIRAAFFLTCIAESEFLFEFDAGHGGEWDRALVEAIDQYTFAEKQELSPPSKDPCVWVLGDLSDPKLHESAHDFGLKWISHGDRDFGRQWISAWGQNCEQWKNELLRSGASALEEGALERWRLEKVRPWFCHEVGPEVMPLELGLLDGITQGKGCYPGQEVIERILTQGSTPRKLARLRGDDGSAKLALVRKNESKLGTEVVLTSGFKGTVEQCID
ncbi:MAG: YgfZ/GcvT domain-containing protein [Oligoflexia bacterium]